MLVWRLQNGLRLPLHWSYSDAWERDFDDEARRPCVCDNRAGGFQVWNRLEAVLCAALGQDRDGRYDDLRYLLTLSVEDTYGGAGEWSAVRPDSVRTVAAIPRSRAARLALHVAGVGQAVDNLEWNEAEALLEAAATALLSALLAESKSVAVAFYESLPRPRSYGRRPSCPQ
jgi:hypothetical protein